MAATRQNSVAVACVVEALDGSGSPRKAFALDIGIGDAELSRSLSGAGGARFDVAWLDDVPPMVALDWLRRYAERKFGARVLVPEPEELFQRLLADVADLTNQVRALHVVRDLNRKGAA